MKALIKIVLIMLGCLSLDPVLAQPKAAAEPRSVADTIHQLERDWVDAMIAGDIDKLNQIIADDWTEGIPGKIGTKASFLADVRSGRHKLETCTFGPSEVKVFGDVAVLQGSVTETSSSDGQHTTYQVGYMDVWLKRGARWVVVRSHANKL